MAGRLSLVTASNSMTQQPQISEEQAPPSASRQSRASIIETWFEAHNDLAVATISYAVFCLKKKKRKKNEKWNEEQCNRKNMDRKGEATRCTRDRPGV